MFYEIIATLIAGVAGAGIVLLLNKLSGGRLPKWAMPVGAGLAMIVTTMANEYAWYGRTKDTLPDGFQVIQTVENKALYRPWTYVAPFVERFIALDAPSLRTHSAKPALRMVDTYVMGRWSAPQKMVVLTDCEAGLRAPLVDAVSFAEDGTVAGVDWFAPGEGDPLIGSICELERPS
ncbi:hypothetical protein [Aliiroseovarius sp. 2305UL8-7]|uniref:hypothetical protein n=1 Tax=Aliiroseovarius conchicola TaxID=3121637 RepID=UPI0035298985